VEIRVLRYFLAVLDRGTVTAAADLLHVAQPSISRQIAGLERELGLVLFDRSGPRLSPTPAGHAFGAVARDLVLRADQARATARALAAGDAPQLVVGAPTATIEEVVAPFIATLTPDDPILLVRTVPSSEAYRGIDDGIDMIISAGPPPGGLEHVTLARVPLSAQVPAGQSRARAGVVSIEELTHEKLLLLPHDHVIRSVLDRSVADAGLSYRDVIECESSRAIQGLAAAGFGIGVVGDLPRFGLESLTIRTSTSPLQMTLHAAWPADHYAAGHIRHVAHRIAIYVTDRFEPLDRPR
jgi:DNA-binding transcriptional LysR family regulator